MTNEITEAMIAQLESLLGNVSSMHNTLKAVIRNMKEINKIEGVGPSASFVVTLDANTVSSKTYAIGTGHNEIIKEGIIGSCKTTMAHQAGVALRALASLNEAEAMLKELSNNGGNKDG